MDDFLFLRFRDILQDSIEKHNEISQKNRGDPRALWGWWKKETESFPLQPLSELKDYLESNGHRNSSTIFFVNSGNKKLYKAELFRIHFDPEIKLFRPEEANAMCPEYYNDNPLYAWFEIGQLSEIEPKELEDYVFSTCNSTFKGNGLSAISEDSIGQPVDTTSYRFLEDDVSLWFICKKENLQPTTIKIFPNIYYKTYLTQGRYILHLSDLHFGTQHTYAIPNVKSGIIGRQTLVDSVCRDLSTQGIRLSEIALILITGDLTCTADAQEFNEAFRFIEELKHRFGLGAGQIICVPGNHDIEWINQDGVLNEDAELNYRNFMRRIYNCEAEDSLIRINEFYISGQKIAIFALNSCRIESYQTAGMGYVGNEQMQSVEDFVKSNPDLQYKIAILHHHLLPVNYTETYSSTQKNISMLLDSEALMQNLISCGIQTVLHGHQHQPYFSKINRIIPRGVAGDASGIDGYLNVIGGGSAGVDQAHLNSIGRNTYNLLELVEDGGNIQLHTILRVRNSHGVGYITGIEKNL